MTKTVSLQEEEIAYLVSKYQQEVLDIDREIQVLADRRKVVESRITELVNVPNEEKVGRTTKTKVTIKKRTVQEKLSFPPEPITDISQAITFSKKIQYTLYVNGGELSTGETYSPFIALFPGEADKDKTKVVANISKELGHNVNKIYKKTSSKDANGKNRFSLLSSAHKK